MTLALGEPVVPEVKMKKASVAADGSLVIAGSVSGLPSAATSSAVKSKASGGGDAGDTEW